MPVPTSFSDLSTTPSSNSPAGSENVFPNLDDYIRFVNAALASIKANTATNGWVSPYIAGSGSWEIPGTIGSTTPNTGKFTTLQSTGLTTADSLTVTTTSTFTGVATFTGTPTGAGLTARFSTPGPIGNTTPSTVAATIFTGSGSGLTSIPAAQLTGDVSKAQMATNLNASGSAGLYVARAWMVFNGTGTPSLTAGGGVTSTITDNGVGDYTINFSPALPTADYAVQITTNSSTVERTVCNVHASSIGGAPTTKTTTQLRLTTGGESTKVDPALLMLTVVC